MAGLGRGPVVVYLFTVADVAYLEPASCELVEERLRREAADVRAG